MDGTTKDLLILPSPDSEQVKGGKGIFSSQPAPIRFSPDDLNKKLVAFIDTINAALTSLPKFVEPYHLDEIELKIEINAEGNIQLIGGVKAGATGGITLTLRHQDR